MTSGEFVLWGIDGELKGSEHLLQIRLPMFVRDGEERFVYLARRVMWSPELREDAVVRVPRDRAAEYGDPLDIGRTVIEPGHFTVVVGPELRKNLAAIEYHLPAGPAQTSDGFAVFVREVDAAEDLATDIEKWARRVFDQHIAGGFVTDGARAALAVMRNVSVGDLRAHILRTLLVHFLDGDTDRYRRALRLAQTRLRDSAEVLEREVVQQYELSRRMAVQATPLTSQSFAKSFVKGFFVKDLKVGDVPHAVIRALPDPLHELPMQFFKKRDAKAVTVVENRPLINPKLLFRGIHEDDDTANGMITGEA